MQSLLLWFCIIATLGLEVRGVRIKRQQKISSLCLGKDGIFVAMPGSCSGFFVCVDGNAIANSCGNFYQFNADLGICDHPSNVNCKGQTFSNALAIGEVSSDTEAVFVCARSAPEGHVFAKSRSCNQFYVCHQKVAIRRVCPPQRYFNKNTKVCEDATTIECAYSNKWETSTATTMPEITIGSSPPGSTNNPIKGSGLKVNFSLDSVCSSVKENMAVSHPLDCGKFIYCLKKRPLILSCQNHLHFNSARQRCEWPSVAKCLA